MKITIRKGAHEIGGTCIEVSTKTTTILLDVGLPLSEDSRPADLTALNFDAVVLSHPHQDHFGLLGTIDPSIPVYLGKASEDLIGATRLFLNKPPLENNFKHFSAWEPFEIGDLRVTPYLMDHSACDAYAFLLEADGKRVFYTGDFRAHGRKEILFKKLINAPPADVDVMLMEGTMLCRENTEFPNEKAVENKIRDTLESQENISFLISSSQNIDRMVSAWKACRDTDKTLVVDIYTAWVLNAIRDVAPGVPKLGWPHLKVLALFNHSEVLKKHVETFGSFGQQVWSSRIKIDEIRNSPTEYLVLARPSLVNIIESFRSTKKVNLIYSQWKGYLDPERHKSRKDKRFAELQDDPDFAFSYAHTSGHAVVDDLKILCKAIQPKVLVPIHTEFGSEYDKHFENVKHLTENVPSSI